MKLTLNYVPLNDKPFMLTHEFGEERYFFTRDELPELDKLCREAVVTMEPVSFFLEAKK